MTAKRRSQALTPAAKALLGRLRKLPRSMTLREAARELGVRPQTVAEIETRALAKIAARVSDFSRPTA